MKVGFSLLGIAVLLTPVSKVVTYFLRKAHIDGCKADASSLLEINGTEITLTAVLVFSAVLCILPVSDWLGDISNIIAAWRKKK